MRNSIFLIAGAGVVAASAGAIAQSPASSPPGTGVRQLIQNCDAHKFETIVHAMVDGQPHDSRVKLCGNEGQSDADWIGTLKDAVAKVAANKDMDPAVRIQIASAINAEITRLSAVAAGTLPPPRAIRAGAKPLADDFAALPPLPAAPPPPPHLLRAVPNSPATTTVATGGPAAVPVPQLAPAAPVLRLEFACFTPGDIGGEAPCTDFARETMVTVRAKDDVTAGTALRFVRNGDQRGDVDLAGLKRGRSIRVALPSEICAGLGDGKLELQIVQAGFEVASDGPYALRC